MTNRGATNSSLQADSRMTLFAVLFFLGGLLSVLGVSMVKSLQRPVPPPTIPVARVDPTSTPASPSIIVVEVTNTPVLVIEVTSTPAAPPPLPTDTPQPPPVLPTVTPAPTAVAVLPAPTASPEATPVDQVLPYTGRPHRP